MPEVNLASFEKYTANEYLVKIENKLVDEKIKEIAKNQPSFIRQSRKISKRGDLVIFDYNASVDGEKFEGSEGKNTRLVVGEDLFLKGFDQKLIGVKKEENKTIEVNLPENYPKKNLRIKKPRFEGKIINIQKPNETKIDDTFAKNLGAKDLADLKF